MLFCLGTRNARETKASTPALREDPTPYQRLGGSGHGFGMGGAGADNDSSASTALQ
jgi:hypothetical protein